MLLLTEAIMKKIRIALSILIIAVSLCMLTASLMDIEVSKSVRLAAAIVDGITAVAILFLVSRKNKERSE